MAEATVRLSAASASAQSQLCWQTGPLRKRIKKMENKKRIFYFPFS
jgi:hypothetical protein